MSHLDNAYLYVTNAATAADFVHARGALRRAADELRAARAFDLARYVERELDHAVDAPYVDSILDAIDRRALGRAMKVAI